MNLKNALKNVDYKGLALQHIEKVVIAVATALLVLFVVGGVRKAMSASGVTPQRIDELAKNLDKSVRTSEWNESVAERDNIKNPDFKALIAELMSGIRPDQFLLGQLYFHFVDYGGILRQKPEILTPYHALALADKGAVLVYKVDPKTGEFIEKEVTVKATPRKKPDEDNKKEKKKPTPKQPTKGAGGMSSGMAMSGGPGSDMQQQMMGEYGTRSSGMSSRQGGGGAGAMGKAADDDGGGMSGNLGATRERKTTSIRRSASKQSSDDSIYDEMDDQKTAPATGPADKAQPKVAQKRKIKEEEVRGVRWAMITALFRHRDQVKKFAEALHGPDDPPNYEMVKVERREVLSDGTLSEWAPLDVKKLLELQKCFPEKWVPEDPAVKTAKADFPGLMMRLPELEVGSWVKYVRLEAHKSAVDITGAQTGLAGRRGRESDDDGGMSAEEDTDMMSQILFRGQQQAAATSAGMSGLNATGGGMGAAGKAGGIFGGGTDVSGGAGGAGAGRERRGGVQPQTPASGKTATPQQPVQRSNAEIVQIRFVDYTVEPEHTYQYHLKVVVKNPNYNRFDVIPPEINTEKTLMSEEWSDPTPLVFVPPDLEYYVLDRVRGREEAKLQVHKWLADLGDWQFSDFFIKPGDPIGSRVRDYQLVGWDDPPKVKKTELDFSTQDLLLDVTGGDKPFLFEVDGSEIKFTERIPTEIFVVDLLGDLAVRNDDFDKNNVDRMDRVKYISEVREKAKANDEKEKEGKKSASKAEAGSRDDFEGRSAPSRRDSPERN